MKKNITKKLEFKKTNIVELNADSLKTIIGGSIQVVENEVTDPWPRSIYTSTFCLPLI